ncbi:MAG: hypothetical protein RMM08_11460, partial [Armatimonadota bacterium]|nr:hypothetical protein [Armatimonadota bacterium]
MKGLVLSRWRLVWSVVVTALCVMALSSRAPAQFTFGSAGGEIDFAHAQLGAAAGGAPQFSTAPVQEPWGTLKAPGGGYPTINLATWNSVGGFGPAAMFNYVPVSSTKVGPAPFGAGHTTMFAFA